VREIGEQNTHREKIQKHQTNPPSMVGRNEGVVTQGGSSSFGTESSPRGDWGKESKVDKKKRLFPFNRRSIKNIETGGVTRKGKHFLCEEAKVRIHFLSTKGFLPQAPGEDCFLFCVLVLPITSLKTFFPLSRFSLPSKGLL